MLVLGGVVRDRPPPSQRYLTFAPSLKNTISSHRFARQDARGSETMQNDQ